MMTDMKKTTVTIELGYYDVKSGAPDWNSAIGLLQRHGFSATALLLRKIADQADGLVNPITGK